MATSHLKDPISTTTNLDEACPLDTSCDHLLHLDSPSLSSELQDNSSVDSVDIENVNLTGFRPSCLSIQLGFGPKTHQLGWFEGGDKPGAQIVGYKQATTINTLKIGKNTL